MITISDSTPIIEGKNKANTTHSEGYPIFIMTVGVSYSGKSKWAQDTAQTFGNTTVVSSDAIRGELFGDEGDQTHNDKVFTEMFKRSVSALQDGKNVIYDATNLNGKKRTRLIKQLRYKFPNCTYNCAVFCTRITTLFERAQSRERKVPAYVVWKQLCSFQVPLEYEGFDGVFTIHEADTFDIEQFSLIPMKHDCKHHNERVDEHMLLAYNYAKYYLNDNRTMLLDACRYHDIGKLLTKSFVDHNGDLTEYAHFYNHHSIGSYLILCSDLRERADDKEYDLLELAWLVNHHMDFYLRKDGLEDFLKTVPARLSEQLKILHIIDKFASVQSC